ncbi:MAG: undecaprenyldiphospho-muramoylpentapeptide beta-N-acetylglucosaminyltransferase [Gammaproteobacteria bacterium]|nr:MAG: undecaprenyldiphospho-muramoylpentapeptide beta-N-acetylglucosaminyltransferase [Gammaproteobacteria bacterium]TLY74759.1 MAG: undecaprenyldiphospho-muramoylpentapeptide beta-N-acetylglucosaminyltransferase [Gammaproteobacteria bacterium]
MNARPILIMAGGTGGHVFPALALARILREKSLDVVWLGTQRGLEARVVPAEGIALEWLSVGGLRGKGLVTLLAAPFRLAVALTQALRVMWRRRPLVVVGLGGFVTGPGGVAAWLTRRPLVIHEQNAIAGFTNRCLAHLAREVLEAFPGSFGGAVQARVIGNPVRQDISALPPPAARFASRSGPIRVLVIGGSQGAARLNAVVPFALARLAGSARFDVRHQAGERWLEAARQSYANAGVRAGVHPFIEDMAEAYGWADLVICRSGALTVSELAAVGVGAILVPFPAAVDDHQTHNAQYLVREGAAVLIADRELTAERLAGELQRLCAGRGKLLAMAERARLLAKPRAAHELAASCLELARRAA